MRALVVWEMTIAIHLPTDMISMHASLACLHVCPASSNVMATVTLDPKTLINTGISKRHVSKQTAKQTLSNNLFG